MELDIVAFGAHPDDVELACAGTLVVSKQNHKKVGIVDLTRGQLGTRGTPELREKEATEAARILGVDVRVNLGMEDGFFQNDEDHQMEVIKVIRHLRPKIILANALADRHPDHGKAGRLVADAAFLAGLQKIQTVYQEIPQEAWRPSLVLHYVQDYYIKPNIVIDITRQFDRKMEAIKAYKSQFFNPDSTEPATPISGEEFFDVVRARALGMGRYIKAELGEGFISERPLGVEHLSLLK